MSVKLKSSKLMSVAAILIAAAIVVSYSVMSDNKTDNAVYYTELAVYVLVGIFFSFGISLVNKGRKNIAIPIGCASLVLPAFVIPILTAAYRNVPYLLQVSLYAKRTMTMLCPFFAAVLLKWLCSMTERKRHGAALTSFSYFVITFAVIALLQGVMKWQYFFWYGIDTTWNAMETFYWAITINVVYIRQMLTNTADTSDEYSKEVNRRRCLLYILIADAAAAFVLILKSYHIKGIMRDFVVKLTVGGPVYALCNSTWLSYRVEILKGIISRKYSVSESMFLERFPDEFPVRILWASEPLSSTRLVYGWSAALALLMMFAILIVLFQIIGHEKKTNYEIGVWIRYSFTTLCCLSFVSQMFVPTYGMIMPLMGDGACMIALLIVYIALPKMKSADSSCMEKAQKELKSAVSEPSI